MTSVGKSKNIFRRVGYRLITYLSLNVVTQTVIFLFCTPKLMFLFLRSQRAKPVIIDPGFYSSEKSDLFWISEKRKVPTAFKLFTG